MNFRDPHLFLEQLLHQLFGGFRIALPLDEEVQNFAFIINGAPKPIPSMKERGFPSGREYVDGERPRVRYGLNLRPEVF